MIPRASARSLRRATTTTTTIPHRCLQIFPRCARTPVVPSRTRPSNAVSQRKIYNDRLPQIPSSSSSSASFHTSTSRRAQAPTADALMENLNELYATAKDEFEIAAEETEKKTVYAADDREAAQDALKMLQEAFTKAVKESDPDVSKEIQSRVGQRIRELENAVKAMEEMAMED